MFKPLPIALAILAAIAALALFLLNADQMFMVGSIRYKLSMTVQVDDRLVTASAIQEVGYFDLPPWMLTQSRNEILLRGNALTVDLGNLGSLVLRRALGFALPETCAVVRGDDETLSAWYQRQRAKLPLCSGLRVPYTGKPQILVAPPYTQPFPPTLISNPTMGGAIAPGFKVIPWAELSEATQGRVKLVGVWDEVTEDPLTISLPPAVKWLQPLIDRTISYIAATTSHGGFSIFRPTDFAKETFHF